MSAGSGTATTGSDLSIDELTTGLEAKLEEQARYAEKWESYYVGKSRHRLNSAKFQKTFAKQLENLRSNWSRVIVDTAAERMSVTGVKFPSQKDEASKDLGADELALRIWQENGLDSRQHFAHTTAIYAGVAYLLVAPPEKPGGVARITVEHPSQFYVATDSLGRRLSAIKKWQEVKQNGQPGDWFITIYTPNWTYRLRRPAGGGALTDRYDDDRDKVRNTLGVVPGVPMLNRPLLLLGGQSDIEPVGPLQDLIDKELENGAVNSEFSSFPQRWATGIDIPIDPATNKPLDREQFMAAADRLWAAKAKDAKFGQFQAHDGGGTIAMISMLVQHMAAQTNTPPHYLLGAMVNISGDALRAAEAGLYSRVRAKHLTFGEAWETAIRIACGWMGDKVRMNDEAASTMWANPEVRSEGEMVDAGLKLWSGRMLPLEMVLERCGYAPRDIERAIRLLGMPDRPEPPNTNPDAAADDAAQDETAAELATSAA